MLINSNMVKRADLQLSVASVTETHPGWCSAFPPLARRQLEDERAEKSVLTMLQRLRPGSGDATEKQTAEGAAW